MCASYFGNDMRNEDTTDDVSPRLLHCQPHMKEAAEGSFDKEEEEKAEVSSSTGEPHEGSIPFSLCLSDQEIEEFSPQDIDSDEIIKRALNDIHEVEECIASAGRLRRDSILQGKSMKALFQKMKSRYTRRRSSLFLRDAGHFDTTLQMIEALR